MININFKSIKIEGFQSLSNVELDFSNLGICYIQGINNSNEKSKSNGAGKSSLCEAIIWTLYGKTSKGIGNDVVNKYYDKGCYVELIFILNNITYVVRRSIKHKKYKTNLTIIRDDEDISAKNKSDSDKILKEILEIEMETFCQFIFLSQGFNTRFALYTPKLRRELLETLYISNGEVDNFISEMKSKLVSLMELQNKQLDKRGELLTNISICKNNINIFNQSYLEFEYQIEELQNSNFNISEEDVNTLKEKLTKTNDRLMEEKVILEKMNNKLHYIDVNINRIRIEIGDLTREIDNLKNSRICPTCGTELKSTDDIQPHIDEIENKIKDLQNKGKEYTQNGDKLNKSILAKTTVINELQQEVNKLIEELRKLEYNYNLQVNAQIQIENLKSQQENAKIQTNDNYKKLQNFEKELEWVKQDLDKSIKNIEIINHIIRLSNNQFKAYLLNSIISYLNQKLFELSTSLFDNNVISINGDNKLDIVLGDKLYEQLSGGEQRKIDIALVLAQRMLAQELHSISSNIIIFDEIFDNLDDVAFSVILGIILDSIDDVESMFIISHRNINEIPFDRVITLIKDENQLSYLSLE